MKICKLNMEVIESKEKIRNGIVISSDMNELGLLKVASYKNGDETGESMTLEMDPDGMDDKDISEKLQVAIRIVSVRKNKENVYITSNAALALKLLINEKLEFEGKEVRYNV